MSSLVSEKAPPTTVRLAPLNFTRLPFELGWSPSPASMIPAFTSSSLYFIISLRSPSGGRAPASEALVVFTITITRIVVPPSGGETGGPSLALLMRRTSCGQIDTDERFWRGLCCCEPVGIRGPATSRDRYRGAFRGQSTAAKASW